MIISLSQDGKLQNTVYHTVLYNYSIIYINLIIKHTYTVCTFENMVYSILNIYWMGFGIELHKCGDFSITHFWK